VTIEPASSAMTIRIAVHLTKPFFKAISSAASPRPF
jgi:hypothetical protein